MEIRDSVIWITGASSGVGEALAVALSAKGARLVLSARRAERLEEVARRCGADRCRVLPLDVSDTSALDEAAVAAAAAWGRIDALVSNAGVSQRSHLAETESAVIRKLLDTNFLGPVLLTRAVLGGMIRRGSGTLLYVSSLVGRVGTPLRTIYSASKHALHGFADSLRAELHPRGVRVTVVAPGWVRTEMSYAALEADGRPHAQLDPGQAGGISAERAAERIVRALERDEREVYVGLGFRGRLALVLSRLAPGLLARVVRSARVT